MATITKNTSGMTGNRFGKPQDIQDLINTLLVNIKAGNVITASDINNVMFAQLSFLYHYHTVDDLYGLWNYGDGRPGIDQPILYSSSGSYELSDSTSLVLLSDGSAPPTATVIQVGDTITASKHNEIRNSILALQNHKHTWDDRTS